MVFHTLNPNLILGYHGCEKTVGEDILAGRREFKKSNNKYDWLGDGIYFWESNPRRAHSFACELQDKGKIREPFVVGAVLSLGKCIDTLNEESINAIKNAYDVLKETLELIGSPMPINRGGEDLLLRDLDRSVIVTLHSLLRDKRQRADSVRGLYTEGKRLYDNAGFYAKTHVQIAIRSKSCIKGIFRVKPSEYE